MDRLKGKVVLVTGAGSGIGQAIAKKLAEEGAKVVIVDISEQGGNKTVKMIQGNGGEAFFIRSDISRSGEVENMVARTVEKYGRLDCAVNNAGVEAKLGDTVEQTTESDFDRVIGMNVKGTWLCMKYEIMQMHKQGSGNIVSTASSFGLLATAGNPAYCATKAAIINLTREMALDYGPHGIRVNCICPGAIETPRFRGFPPQSSLAGMSAEKREELIRLNKALLRMGLPEEVAYGVLFLVSDEASFITGHALVIDGGQTIGV